MSSAPVMLSVNGIEVIYNHVILVLKGVSLTVREGGIVALLGANGAGKTTTLRALCQMVRTTGSVVFDGQQLVGKPTEAVVRMGVAHVPDGRGTFAALSVEEKARNAAAAMAAFLAEHGSIRENAGNRKGHHDAAR